MNTQGRGLFANVMLDGFTLIVTYQTAPANTISDNKSLYYRTYDRSLGELTGEQFAIDVNATSELVDWTGDLGDQKLTLMGDYIYMVAVIREQLQVGIMKFDKSFNALTSPLYLGNPDKLVEAPPDMGFINDGQHVYVQVQSRKGDNPMTDWGAALYQVTADLEAKNSAVVYPEGGSFVTGTAVLFVPKGEMGMTDDRLQIFSSNKDYGNSERVGLHTFGATMMLEYIADSRVDIIERELDVYFPTGPSFNTKHQIWVVGYSMENFEGDHGGPNGLELGPSFIEIFDTEWNSLKTIPVNGSSPAFRVMTQTVDDDIYVVYDEMDKQGSAATSRARIEHYTITAPQP